MIFRKNKAASNPLLIGVYGCFLINLTAKVRILLRQIRVALGEVERWFYKLCFVELSF